jgi:hypothetical protein
VDEYVCVTVRSRPGEGTADFAARLSHFWTHMLRNHKGDFERVYAETTCFAEDAGRWTRQYLVADEVVSLLERELQAAGLDHAPTDRDEVFTKYEAVPPEWMQIEH